MPRLMFCGILLLLMASHISSCAIRPTFSKTETVRIMPLGDSITGSPGCWRAMLWHDLQSNGLTNLDFVGGQTAQHCALQHDANHEGHGGLLVIDLAREGRLSDWLKQARPDVVLMHLGTNDIWQNTKTEEILAAYTELVQQMRVENPNILIMVAQLIDLNPRGISCNQCPQRVIALNAAIPPWAARLSQVKSPIIVVDQWTGFNVLDDTYDGAHPTAYGNQKIAKQWAKALRRLWQ